MSAAITGHTVIAWTVVELYLTVDHKPLLDFSLETYLFVL